MSDARPPFQRAFFDLLGGGDPARLRASPIRATVETAAWAEVIADLRDLALAPAPQTMVIEEVEAIWSAIAERDDWAPLHAKVAAVRKMGAFNAALGLLRGPNARPGHTPLGSDEAEDRVSP